ncbi:MAG: hypothetical protein WC341_07750 [Bacteroidales bacterium]|jgi:hypothetical protein
MTGLFSKEIRDELIKLDWIERMPEYPAVPVSKIIGENIIRIPEGLSGVGYANKYEVLWISSKETAVLFIEDWGTVRNDPDENWYTANFRLIGQVNLKQLGTYPTVDELIIEVMAAMPERLTGKNYLFNPDIEFVGIVAKTPAIFARYTLDETEKQNLMFPYDYFALEYHINFQLNPDCFKPEEKEKIC